MGLSRAVSVRLSCPHFRSECPHDCPHEIPATCTPVLTRDPPAARLAFQCHGLTQRLPLVPTLLCVASCFWRSDVRGGTGPCRVIVGAELTHLPAPRGD